jgi:hypothetical protein
MSCLIKAKGISRSISKTEDAEIKNDEKYEIIAAETLFHLLSKAI